MKTWNDLKQVIGEDLALFTIFMASLEASEILEGLIKSAKGAKYLSDGTIDQMYQEMSGGIARETLENHLSQCKTELENMDKSVFCRGLDDLSDWMEMADQQLASGYFSYLSSWDLEGHDWMKEKPLTFASYCHPELQNGLSS